MKTLFKIPYWIISVFTWDKSFRNNPIIGNYWLNKLGLHVFRVILSHALFSFRLWLLSPLIPNEDRQAFKENGFILKYNFLPEAEFIALKNEILSYQGEISEIIEGETINQRLFLNKAVFAQLPLCQRFTRHPVLNKLMRYCSSKNRFPLFEIENLKFHRNNSTLTDPQQDLHTDTFHPCVKGWFFMDEVNETNGAHCYVPGSHKLSWQRLRWEYRESLMQSLPAHLQSTERYWNGSFRVNVEDLQSWPCQPPRVFYVPANTLLIGNVHGVHSRGAAIGQTSRLTIAMHARDNPFNPLITPFPQLTADVVEFFWQRIINNRYQKLRQAGMFSTSNSGFHE
jgi:hypothetical protein